MDFVLDPVETRIIGCLLEKEITTPEYYPLTLNALINACNQRSNREPVVSYDEDTVADAIDCLRGKHLITVLTGGSNRVPKYGHRLGERLNLGRRESALLCEMMLRGPQTVGELKDRAGRMHRFSDLEEVESCLRAMAEFPVGALVTQVARQPGRKEARYTHLLGGEPAAEEHVPDTAAPRAGMDVRVTTLETEVRALREQIARIERELGLS
jgi:uncharacterized protein YceH (UPF0502 family)